LTFCVGQALPAPSGSPEVKIYGAKQKKKNGWPGKPRHALRRNVKSVKRANALINKPPNETQRPLPKRGDASHRASMATHSQPRDVRSTGLIVIWAGSQSRAHIVEP
jgi:hypothetical protein